jgi:hypothetical protein
MCVFVLLSDLLEQGAHIIRAGRLLDGSEHLFACVSGCGRRSWQLKTQLLEQELDLIHCDELWLGAGAGAGAQADTSVGVGVGVCQQTQAGLWSTRGVCAVASDVNVAIDVTSVGIASMAM